VANRTAKFASAPKSAPGAVTMKLRRKRLTHVVHRCSAGESEAAHLRQRVVLGEVALQLDHRPPLVGSPQRASAHRRQSVDTRLYWRADDPAEDDDAPAPD
jgi:hypothetical protein